MTFYVKDAEGNVLNTIEASHAFAKQYAEATGYILEYVPDEPEPEPKPEPTIDERVTDLEDALAATDETAIELYEAMMAQEEINTAQDDALIELYEMIGG